MADSISQRARTVTDAFDVARRSCDDDDETSKEELDDAHTRFRLWAGNLGAFHPTWDTKSLDYRLRQERAVTQRIQEILVELTELLNRFVSSKTGEQEIAHEIKRTDDADETDDFVAEFLDLRTSTACEVSWLTDSITDAVRRLFKISRLIEKSTTRDRYARAEASADVNFDYRYDLAHVQAKHASCRAETWLIDRLGKAITKRRMFLKYAREHRDRLDATPGPEQRDQDALPTVANPILLTQHLAVPSVGPTQISKPSLEQTTASTLAPIDVNYVDTGFDDDDRTCYTRATSVSDGRSSDRLRVARLEKFAISGEPFQCPYCCTIQKFNGQITWERHVFADLRAYLCTSKECSMITFARKQDWIDHELEKHRRQWQCQLCGHLQFESEDTLLRHIRELHAPNLTTDISKALLKTSSRPLSIIDVKECPLCDWEATMREVNTHVAKIEKLGVNPQRFMRHLAGHLEELALFAIPRGGPSDDSDHSDGTEDSFNVSHRDRGDVPYDVMGYISNLDAPSIDGTASNSSDDGAFEYPSALENTTADFTVPPADAPGASDIPPAAWFESGTTGGQIVPTTLNVGDWFEFFGIPPGTVLPEPENPKLPSGVMSAPPKLPDEAPVVIPNNDDGASAVPPTTLNVGDWFEFFDVPSNTGYDPENPEFTPRTASHEVNCICRDTSRNGPYVSCKQCGTLQHTECYYFGFKDITAEAGDHSCLDCHPRSINSGQPQNPREPRYGPSDEVERMKQIVQRLRRQQSQDQKDNPSMSVVNPKALTSMPPPPNMSPPRPEKCPIPSCSYHVKGFARRDFKIRHTMAHYKASFVCGFCTAEQKTFGKVEDFKRHLVRSHGAVKQSCNTEQQWDSSHGHGSCDICFRVFQHPQGLYAHLDDCILWAVERYAREDVDRQGVTPIQSDDEIVPSDATKISTMPSLQLGTSNSILDEYTTEWGPDVKRILDHYLENMSIDLPKTAEFGELLRARLLPLILSEKFLLDAVLAVAGADHSRRHGAPMRKISSTTFYQRALSSVQDRMRLEASITTDVTVAGILKMATYDLLFGSHDDYAAHMRGLKSIVSLRRKTSNTALGNFLELSLLWVDIHGALITGQPAVFEPFELAFQHMHLPPDMNAFAPWLTSTVGGDYLAPQSGSSRTMSDYSNTLMQACELGDLALVQLCLRNDPNCLDKIDGKGHRPLHEAVTHRRASIVSYLLKQGCRVNDKTLNGQTPLRIAVSQASLHIVQMLLEAGADPTSVDSRDLLAAAGQSYAEEVRKALNNAVRAWPLRRSSR